MLHDIEDMKSCKLSILRAWHSLQLHCSRMQPDLEATLGSTSATGLMESEMCKAVRDDERAEARQVLNLWALIVETRHKVTDQGNPESTVAELR
eukprot:4794242-Amphidinium_carterae.1